MFCLPAKDTTISIAVVVTPLNLVAIMESVVKQSCPQAIPMLISKLHPFLVIKFYFHNSFVLLLPNPFSSKQRVWPCQTTLPWPYGYAITHLFNEFPPQKKISGQVGLITNVDIKYLKIINVINEITNTKLKI